MALRSGTQLGPYEVLAPLGAGGMGEVYRARDERLARDVDVADWSRDGTRFAIARRDGAKHVLEYPIGTVVHETAGDFSRISISPDGTRLAMVERPSLGVVGDQPIRFSADGGQLFIRYGQQDESKARIALLDLATGRKQPWRVLSPADPAGVTALDYVFLTPDGRGYLYNYFRTLSDLFLVEGLK